MLAPETYYVLWTLAFLGLIAGLALLRARIGRWWRRTCGDESAAAVADSHSVQRDVMEVRPRRWDGQQVAIVTAVAFVAGISVGLVF